MQSNVISSTLGKFVCEFMLWMTLSDYNLILASMDPMIKATRTVKTGLLCLFSDRKWIESGWSGLLTFNKMFEADVGWLYFFLLNLACPIS